MVTRRFWEGGRLSTAIICALGAGPALGAEWHIQPRVNMGFSHYELNYDPTIATTGPTSGASVGRFTIDDNMPTVSGGFTVFLDRFFVDFSAINSFNGSANSNLVAITPFRRAGLAAGQSTTDVDFQSNIDRIEYAFAGGYQVTPHWVLYAGYRHTETQFDQSIGGKLTTLIPTGGQVDPAGSGSLTADGDLNFTYDGPFVGTSYSWDFSDAALPGSLSGNVALAFMDGSSRTRFQNIRFNGAAVRAEQTALAILRPDLDGDTVGLSLGLNWRGSTRVTGLSYLFGVSGYRYEFDNARSNSPGFDETLIRVDLGLGYAFQL